MSLLKRGGKAGRFLIFTLLFMLIVPLIFGLLTSGPVSGNLDTVNSIVRGLMLPLLMFRFCVYCLIGVFYRSITEHFARKLGFTEEDLEYALTKRNSLFVWIIGFEFVVSLSLISLMV